MGKHNIFGNGWTATWEQLPKELQGRTKEEVFLHYREQGIEVSYSGKTKCFYFKLINTK